MNSGINYRIPQVHKIPMRVKMIKPAQNHALSLFGMKGCQVGTFFALSIKVIISFV